VKISFRHIILSLLAILCLLTGVFNYLLFQPNIILFHVLRIENGTLKLANSNSIINHFLIGYFSDALWCTALCLITLVLSELKYLNTLGKVLILQLPFTLEAAQYFGIIPGTFDWLDILTYTIIVTAFSLLSAISKS